MPLIRFNFQKQSWKSKFRGILLQSSKWSAKLWWHHFQKQPPELLCKKVFLKILQNSPQNTCVGISLLKKRLRTDAFLFFCEFSEIFKNTSFTEHLWETASVFYWRKKNTLFTLGWKEQRRYDTVMFLLEIFAQNLVLGFFGPKKITRKTHKKHWNVLSSI